MKYKTLSSCRRYYNCSKCGGEKTVEVITKETKQSMSVQINKCTKCKHQWGIKHLLNNGC